MWIVGLKNGKFKYCERYIDPYYEKTKTASVTLEKDTPQAKKTSIKKDIPLKIIPIGKVGNIKG